MQQRSGDSWINCWNWQEAECSNALDLSGYSPVPPSFIVLVIDPSIPPLSLPFRDSPLWSRKFSRSVWIFIEDERIYGLWIHFYYHFTTQLGRILDQLRSSDLQVCGNDNLIRLETIFEFLSFCFIFFTSPQRRMKLILDPSFKLDVFGLEHWISHLKSEVRVKKQPIEVVWRKEEKIIIIIINNNK